MGAQLQEDYLSVAEYLAREEESPMRHEYLEGHIYEMPQNTPAHAKIIFNLPGAFYAGLRGHSCSGSSSHQRIKVERTGLRTYPDVLVSCPPQRFDAEDPNALLNPSLIGEVLSPSTQNYDRTEKWEHYRQISDLQDYLLVSSERVRVEHLHRDENGQWILWTGIERTDILRVASLGLEILLSEIYEGVDVVEGLTRIDNIPSVSD